MDNEDIIDRETMIKLMADMDITESALKMKQSKISRDSIKILSNRAFDSLYLYYKVTPELFKNNLKYYQEDMEQFEQMMEDKITLLSKKKDSVTLEKEVNDSTVIKKAIQVK